MASARPSSLRTMRMPRPPPPAEAFTNAGSPISASDSTVLSGATGTPCERISRFASIFEPIAAMAAGGGPIQVSPASMTCCANAAFSDRNP